MTGASAVVEGAHSCVQTRHSGLSGQQTGGRCCHSQCLKRGLQSIKESLLAKRPDRQTVGQRIAKKCWCWECMEQGALSQAQYLNATHEQPGRACNLSMANCDLGSPTKTALVIHATCNK